MSLAIAMRLYPAARLPGNDEPPTLASATRRDHLHPRGEALRRFEGSALPSPANRREEDTDPGNCKRHQKECCQSRNPASSSTSTAAQATAAHLRSRGFPHKSVGTCVDVQRDAGRIVESIRKLGIQACQRRQRRIDATSGPCLRRSGR
jgi:hypothetical protein